MSRNFSSLSDIYKHLNLSNYDLDGVFSVCEKYTDSLSKNIDEIIKTSIEVSVEETDQSQVFSYDLPGVEKEDIKITVEDSKLTVKVSKKKGKAVNLVSTISIPKTLDQSKVLSQLNLGVLSIRIAKSETVKPRDIPIN